MQERRISVPGLSTKKMVHGPKLHPKYGGDDISWFVSMSARNLANDKQPRASGLNKGLRSWLHFGAPTLTISDSCLPGPGFFVRWLIA